MMNAFRLVEWGRPGQLREVAVPDVRPGEVLVKIGGAGACHSDLHLMEWPEGQLPWKVPFTLGHENAGWVAKVGAGVTSVREGDPVLLFGPWGCGTCHACRLGRENYCERAAEIPAMGGGLGRDGGMAEYMLVPSPRFLIPIGALDPAIAAPLADAGLTPYHAIAKSRHLLHPGSSAVVIGVGGLGQMAIQLLAATTGARIIAVDTDKHKLETARKLGAHEAILSDSSAAEAIRKGTNGGAEVVLDVVGSEVTLALGAKALRAEGRLVIIGLALGVLPVSFFALPMGAEVATSYWGTVPELMELVSLARDGTISLEVERFPLARAPDAFAKLRRGEVQGRAVIVP